MFYALPGMVGMVNRSEGRSMLWKIQVAKVSLFGPGLCGIPYDSVLRMEGTKMESRIGLTKMISKQSLS